MDYLYLLGINKDFPSNPICLFWITSDRNPSMSFKLVNTVSKHCIPAARAARITCPRATIISIPLLVGVTCRLFLKSPPEIATPNSRLEAVQISYAFNIPVGLSNAAISRVRLKRALLRLSTAISTVWTSRALSHLAIRIPSAP